MRLIIRSVLGLSVLCAFFVVLSILVAFTCFAWWSLRGFDRGNRAAIVNAWTVLISVGATYLALDLAAGHLLIKPLSPPFVADAVTHHRMVPNSRSIIETLDYRIAMTNNHLGLRGRDVTRKKPLGVYRVLMLGDSFTLGKGVEDAETFSALLENRLSTDGRSIEVLNGGVDSYSPVLSYLALRESLGDLDPDLVVLNLDMSDPVQEEAYRKVAVFGENQEILAVPHQHPMVPGADWEERASSVGGAIKRWIDKHLFVGRWALNFLDKMMRNLTNPTLRDVVELASPLLLAHTVEPIDRHRDILWDSIFDSVLRIKHFCDDRGVQFLLTVYPWGHQVNDREWVPGRSAFLPDGAIASDRSIRIVEVRSKEAGIELLNLFPVFRARQSDGPIYYDLDMHWRPVGHAIMARALEERIRQSFFGGR